MLIRVILLLSLACVAFTEDVPDWVMVGILKVETKSYYDARGNIVYVDRRIGRHGERGPYQMTRIAFDQIKRPGESFYRLSTDLEFAEDAAQRYLLWLNKHYGKGRWSRVVMMYNAGPNGISRTYLNRVVREGKQ